MEGKVVSEKGIEFNSNIDGSKVFCESYTLLRRTAHLTFFC